MKKDFFDYAKGHFDRWDFYKKACMEMDMGDYDMAVTRFKTLVAYCEILKGLRESCEETEN